MEVILLVPVKQTKVWRAQAQVTSRSMQREAISSEETRPINLPKVQVTVESKCNLTGQHTWVDKLAIYNHIIMSTRSIKVI